MPLAAGADADHDGVIALHDLAAMNKPSLRHPLGLYLVSLLLALLCGLAPPPAPAQGFELLSTPAAAR